MSAEPGTTATLLKKPSLCAKEHKTKIFRHIILLKNQKTKGNVIIEQKNLFNLRFTDVRQSTYAKNFTPKDTKFHQEPALD